MKQIIKTVIVVLLFSVPFGLLAQAPPPPDDLATGGGAGQFPNGGNAPIGSGTVVLLTLGAVYGGKKIYDFNTTNPLLEE